MQFNIVPLIYSIDNLTFRFRKVKQHLLLMKSKSFGYLLINLDCQVIK